MTPAPTELTLAPKMHTDGKRDRGGSQPIAVGPVLGPAGKLGPLWPGSDPLAHWGHHLGRVSPGGGGPAPGDQLEQLGFGRKRPHPIEKHQNLTPRGDAVWLTSRERCRWAAVQAQVSRPHRGLTTPSPALCGSRGCWRSHQRTRAVVTAGEFFSNDVGCEGLASPWGPFLSASCDLGLPLRPPRSSGVGAVPWGWQQDRRHRGPCCKDGSSSAPASGQARSLHDPPGQAPTPDPPIPGPPAPSPRPLSRPTLIFFCPRASPEPSSCPTPGPPCHPPKRWPSLIPLPSPALAGCGLFNKCLIATVKDQLGMTGDFCSGTWAVLRVSNKMYLGRTTEMQGSWGPLEAPLA